MAFRPSSHCMLRTIVGLSDVSVRACYSQCSQVAHALRSEEIRRQAEELKACKAIMAVIGMHL